MTTRAKAGKARFKVGQVVCLKSELMARGNCEVPVRIESFNGTHYQLVQHNGMYWREEELRPLTKHESGQ